MRMGRMRIRTLMIVVAMTAALLGGGQMWRSHRVYRQCATYHARQEASLRRQQQQFEQRWTRITRVHLAKPARTGFWGRLIVGQENANAARGLAVGWLTAEALQAQADEMRPRIEYHAQMKQKYEYAASHPWIITAPNAPVPR